MGYATPSGIQRQLSPAYSEPYYPLDFVERMQVLAGMGTPPITSEEIYGLGPPLRRPGYGGSLELAATRAIDFTLRELGHPLSDRLRRALIDGAIEYVRGAQDIAGEGSQVPAPRSEPPSRKRNR